MPRHGPLSGGCRPAPRDSSEESWGSWDQVIKPRSGAGSRAGCRTGGALGRGAAGARAPRRQVLRIELDAVVAARQARDRSSISVPPRSLTPHDRASVAASSPILTHEACRLRTRPSERQPEDGGVLEVLLARDLLDAVRAPEQRVEGDEAQRHELGDAAGALLQRADDAHVLGQLPRLLDVPEHHRRGRAQAGARAASMISTQRATGSLFGGSARARRRAGPRRRCPGSSPARRR